MKRYKLLKDLPFAKAGDEFSLYRGDDRSMILAPKEWDKHLYEIDISDIKNFDEWFEEIGEPEWVYYVDSFGSKVSKIRVSHIPRNRENLKSIGNYFETEEEAEKYLAYLKAKEVIKQDTEGFKPDWKNTSQKRFFGYFNLIDKTLCHFDIGENMESKIFFRYEEDIEESFKKHPEEWKTYLTYDQ